jgi:RNA-dependent RNA polymerase
MGNFDQEKNILKKYARKGQCFSTSTFVRTLRHEEVKMDLPDIKRNGFTFTDGVGYISKELARLTAAKFGYSKCSAFQIRIAGAKGVLMVKPGMKESLIQLRQSQIKFFSNDLTFNVIRCATFGQGYLNRQIITLLNCLGVPESYFLMMQRKAKEYASV